MIENIESYRDIILQWRVFSKLNEQERNLALEELRRSQFSLLPEKYRADKEIAIHAIEKFSWNILYTTEQLQFDHDLIELAVLKEPSILNYLSKYIKSDLVLAKRILQKELFYKDVNKKNPFVSNSSAQINYYSNLYINEVTKQKVNSSFQFFERNIRNNKEIALLALRINEQNYRFVGRKLKENLEFSLAALKISPFLYTSFFEKIKNNQVICDTLLSIQGDYLDIIPPNKITIENIIVAINNNPLSVFLIPNHYRTNKQICISAVNINGLFLRELPIEMQNDFDVVSKALFNTLQALPYVGKSFSYLIEKFKNEYKIDENNQFLNQEIWKEFPSYFYSSYKEQQLTKLLEEKRRFNFDDPTKNTLETEDDLYPERVFSFDVIWDDKKDEEQDSKGSSGSSTNRTRKKI